MGGCGIYINESKSEKKVLKKQCRERILFLRFPLERFLISVENVNNLFLNLHHRRSDPDPTYSAGVIFF